MSRSCTVHFTVNFDNNLTSIRRFLEEQGSPHLFQHLLSQVLDRVVPNLEEFPEMGANFCARRPLSVDGQRQVAALVRRVGTGASVREYRLEEYLLLYAHRQGDVYLLAIKHHRQLSFDLKGHWMR